MDAELPSTLSVSVVTYYPDMPKLERTLDSLKQAMNCAHAQGLLSRSRVMLVNNGSTQENWRQQLELLTRFDGGIFQTQAFSGHGNVGYGAGHNLAILESDADYHLVLNPDVELDSGCVSAALSFMRVHPNVGLLSPASRNARDEKEYLCKQYPTLLDLIIRGFAPRWLKERMSTRLARYELRGITEEDDRVGVPIVSGCFMFFRSGILRRTGGFDDRFFMYFEDFDLSLTSSRHAEIAYVPAVRIVHLGGGAARKGAKHIRMFAASAFKFFRKNGWRLV